MNATETLAARRDPNHRDHRNLRLRRDLYWSVLSYFHHDHVINLGAGYDCPYKGKYGVLMLDSDPAVIETYRPLWPHVESAVLDVTKRLPEERHENCFVVCEGLFAYLTEERCFEIILHSLNHYDGIIFDWPSAEDCDLIGETAVRKGSFPTEVKTFFDFIMPNGSRIITLAPLGTAPAQQDSLSNRKPTGGTDFPPAS